MTLNPGVTPKDIVVDQVDEKIAQTVKETPKAKVTPKPKPLKVVELDGKPDDDKPQHISRTGDGKLHNCRLEDCSDCVDPSA